MAYVMMTDPATGRVALYSENGTSGSAEDPNSTRNLPLNNPASYLNNIKFSTELDFLEVAFAGSGTITHASIAGIAAAAGQAAPFAYDAGSDDNLLLTHSLGYSPFALVALGSNILWPGMPVQVLGDASGGARYATAYVNSTQLRIATTATIGGTTLPSFAATYSYLVFKKPPAASGNILIDFDPATGIVSMGLGKFSSDKPYLQIVSGGSPLGLSMGRTIDLDNGAPKAWRPDGTTFAPVPAGLATYLDHASYGSVSGSSMAYGGSYAGPSSIQVQAP
jgi:hypothetical protein